MRFQHLNRLEGIMSRLATYAISALMAVTTVLPTMQVSASAQGVEIEIGRDGPKVRMRDRDRCDPRYERCRERWDDRRDRRFCTEERALRKAERMGLRRVRVLEANRRVVVVRGRDRYDDRVRVVFGRDRNCPVYR
jgi:hypothetical protein